MVKVHASIVTPPAGRGASPSQGYPLVFIHLGGERQSVVKFLV